MVYITAVHMSSHGHGHEHIEAVKWQEPASGNTGESTVPVMVDWIEHKSGMAKVTDGVKEVEVYVVHPQPPSKPYLQTAADGRWTNNLLALPRY